MSHQVGRVNDLAWTTAIGEVLDTEAIYIKGKNLILTSPDRRNVMKESAKPHICLSQPCFSKIGLMENFYETLDAHIQLRRRRAERRTFRGDYRTARWHPPTPDPEGVEAIPP